MTHSHGITVDHAICIVEPTTSRAGLYVGMTRGRRTNVAWVVDATGGADAADTVASIIQRPARGITAHAMRDRLHGHVVPHVADADRMRARLDRLEHRPPPKRTFRRV